MPKHWDMESLGTISSDQCAWVTWHKRDELAGVLQEEVSVCWVFSCCFILTVTKVKLTACSSLLPSPHQLCVWSALCFSSFVTLSRTTWNHTLCLLGELPPLQLCLLSLTHKHTPLPSFFNGNRQVCSLFLSLSQTRTFRFFLSFFQTLDSFARPVLHLRSAVFSAPLSSSNAWLFKTMNAGRDWCYGSGSVCAHVWGLFHISFHIVSNRELVKWSNTCLSWARQSIFQTPTETDRQRDKSERAKMRERINLRLERLRAAGGTETNECGGKEMWGKLRHEVLKKKMIGLKSRSKTQWNL